MNRPSRKQNGFLRLSANSSCTSGVHVRPDSHRVRHWVRPTSVTMRSTQQGQHTDDECRNGEF